MIFQYFKPAAAIGNLVSSYYKVTFRDEMADIMRAEIANIRFVLSGGISSDIGGSEQLFGPGTTMLCGPTYQWSNARFLDGTVVFGAAITPLGWGRLLDVPAETLSDQIVPLEDHVSSSCQKLIATLFDVAGDAPLVEAANALFAKMDDPKKPINLDFLDHVTKWVTSPEPNELHDLLVEIDLSQRQIERLCKKYFGSSPKPLHRKFRALHSANRLTWKELTDWRDIATTAYADQSHFIREFKQFNGRTPSEFIEGTHILVRETLRERLQIDHASPFSLIG